MVKRELKIDEAIDIVNGKPSWRIIGLAIVLLIPCQLLTILTVGPTFTGFIPYTQWRCLLTSSSCLERTQESSLTGWNNDHDHDPESHNEYLYLDHRCSIYFKHKTNTTINLYNKDKQHLGAVVINHISVEISSNKSCAAPHTCNAIQNIGFDKSLAETICMIEFGYTENTLVCNGTSVLVLERVASLDKAASQVRYIRFYGDSVNLKCPELHQYNSTTLCGTDGQDQMQHGVDFSWETDGRTSFAMDWGMYCDTEYQTTFYSSLYFFGAMAGLLLCGSILDTYGRKHGIILGYIITIVATFLSALPSSMSAVQLLMATRFFQGFGGFLYYSTTFIYTLECSATKYRNYTAGLIIVSWDVGYYMLVLYGYTIKQWNWLAALPGIVLCFLLAVIPFFPETPRHLLVNKGDEAGTKKSLQWIADLNRCKVDLTGITLKEDKANDEKSFLESLKDFVKYRELTLQVIIQAWQWNVSAFLYYGFAFSWSKFSDSLYLGYFFAAIGDSLSSPFQIGVLQVLLRKQAIMLFFFGASLSFLLALIPLDFGSDIITLEQLSCLIGAMCVGCAWGSIYLYGIESTPTTHRGKLNTFFSFSSRIGSIAGPQASLLFNWSKSGTLIIFALLALSACLVTVRLPETKDIPPPSTSQEVQERRSGRRSLYSVTN